MLLALALALLADDPVAPTAPTAPAGDASTHIATSDAAATSLSDDPTYAEGLHYYTSFEFEKASFRFRAATRNTDLSTAARARAFVWLGLALAQAGDEPSAKEAFARGLKLDAAVDLPPDAPPTIRPTFDAARAHPADEPVIVETHVADDGNANVAAPAAKRRPSTMALFGAGVAGAGVVVAAVGGAVGAIALSQAQDAAKAPFQSDALKAYDDAIGTATIGNVVLISGVLIAVGGTAVVIASPFVE